MTSVIQSVFSRILLLHLALLTLLSLFTTSFTRADSLSFAYKPPGKMVDIGTHKMHLNCQGRYSPTIIIDSGLGGFSLEWVTLQKQLSKYNRVCTYDRSGYGWSEESPNPRTSKEIAKELYALLMADNVPGPYVMVGHSFGGYNIRYFSSQHPNLISGLVFVDASHPEQYKRMPQKKNDLVIETDPQRRVAQVQMARPSLSKNYPEDTKNAAYYLLSMFKSKKTQLLELEQFITSAKQVLQHNYLPDVPVTVITRGKRVWPMNSFGDKSEKVWQELQDELAELGRTSRHLIAFQSGHSVHLDEPSIVYHAILDMVASSRNINKLDVLYVRNN